MKSPTAAVIIPTYNRPDSLACCLDHLNNQTAEPGSFEIIVVDDGGATPACPTADRPHIASIRCFRQKNQGSAAARNFGAAQTQADILIFLDDDIYVQPGFVAGFIQTVLASKECVVVGRLLPYSQPEPTPFQRCYAIVTATDDTTHLTYTDCLTGIMAVRNADFHRIGRMQNLTDDGRAAWGDVAFGYRAQRLGFTFVRSHAAAGVHNDHAISSLERYCQTQFITSRQVVALFRTHPGIVADLPMFRDKMAIQWRDDGWKLISRKLIRQATASRPALRLLEAIVPSAERYAPRTKIPLWLYRWIVSGYIFQGYRNGFAST